LGKDRQVIAPAARADLAQEVASFNVEFTIAEPGPAKTSFGGGLVSPPPMEVYENTPTGEMRRAFAAGTFIVKGDPIKMAQAMIDSVDRSPAPKRLALGSGTYTSIRAALVERLAALDSQKDIAFSTTSMPDAIIRNPRKRDRSSGCIGSLHGGSIVALSLRVLRCVAHNISQRHFSESNRAGKLLADKCDRKLASLIHHRQRFLGFTHFRRIR
jgi:hypothetical protein